MYSFRILDRSYFNHPKIGDNNLTYEKMQNVPEYSSDINKCRDEKLKLQAVVSDLTQVNRRWQKYNSDVQCYVKKLQATIEEQQEQMNNMADIKADHIINPKESYRTNICPQCQPLIELLRRRIHYLELELVNQSKAQDARMFNLQGDSINLQHRLRRANNQIDHLSKLILSKRILNPSSSYGLPGPSTHPRLVNLCGLDGLKIFECDSGYDSQVDTEKSLIDRCLVNEKGFTSSTENTSDEVKTRSLSSSSEADSSAVEFESCSVDTNQISVKDTKLSQPDNFIRKLLNVDKDSPEDTSLKLNIVNPISLSYDESSIVNQHPQLNDKLDDIYEPPGVFETGYFIPNIINAPEVNDKLNIDSFKKAATSFPPFMQDCNKDWLLSEPFKYKSADFSLNCPYCSAFFPPGSECLFQNHIKWCQSSYPSS